MSMGNELSTTLPSKKAARIKCTVTDNESSILTLKSLINAKKRDLNKAKADNACAEASAADAACSVNSNNIKSSSSSSFSAIRSQQQTPLTLTTKYMKNKFKEYPKHSSNNIYKKSSRCDPFERKNRGVEERNNKDDLLFAAESSQGGSGKQAKDVPLEPNDGSEVDGYFEDMEDEEEHYCNNDGDNIEQHRHYHHILGPEPALSECKTSMKRRTADVILSETSSKAITHIEQRERKAYRKATEFAETESECKEGGKSEIYNWQSDLDIIYKMSMLNQPPI